MTQFSRRNALKRGAAAIAGAAVAVTILSAANAADDSELLRLEVEWLAARDAGFKASSELNGLDDPNSAAFDRECAAWDQVNDVEARIVRTPAIIVGG